jgi:arsenate reductase (thioredoxin)
MKLFRKKEKKGLKKIIFLCTANSCRSQMAEGFARQLAPDLLEVYSAGLFAAGIHPTAALVMLESGVDISGQESKVIDDKLFSKMDVIVTLCPNAEKLRPAIPPEARHFHQPIVDPVGTRGDRELVLSEFRRARDEIREKVLMLIEELKVGG